MHTNTGRPTSSWSLSRRQFLGASAAGLALLSPVANALAPASSAPAGTAAAASPAGAHPWIERDPACGCRVPRPLAWHCPASGAGLRLRGDGGISLDEPGWGRREFDISAFVHGQPQDAVRRLFGETVLQELRQELERCTPGMG